MASGPEDADTIGDFMMDKNRVEENIKDFNLKLKEKSESQQSAVDLRTFVTFKIGEELYGTDVVRVHEIIGMVEITHVPKSKKFIKGVINLRGAVVPVLDMRIKFNMEILEFTTFTVIVIVEVKGRLIGMIVDAVSDVIEIPVDDISDSSNYKSTINSDFINSIGRIGEQIIILIDLDRLLDSEGEEEKNLNKKLSYFRGCSVTAVGSMALSP